MATVENRLGMHSSETKAANGLESRTGAAYEDKYYLKEADLADDNCVGVISFKCGSRTQNLKGCAEFTFAKFNPEI